MKKLIIGLVFLSFLSCDSIFHEEDDPYLTINTYQEKIDIINGIYAKLIAIHNGNYFKALRRSDDINLFNNYSLPSLTGYPCRNSDLVDDATISAGIYKNAYSAIVNINKLLTQLDDRTDKELFGELYFLKGYLYLKLARLFGDPPLVDDYYVNYLIEKPSYTEVYEFIEENLLRAIDYLPETYTDARVPGETPNKGTVKALLAEVYLSMAGYPVNDVSKYAEAAKLDGEVIENAEYYGYGLLPDLVSLWKNERRHVKENVFGLFFDDSSWSTRNNLPGFSISDYYPTGELYVRSSYHPGFYFFDHFPDSYRKIHTVTKGYYEAYNVDNPQNVDDPLKIDQNNILVYTLFEPMKDPCPFVQNAIYTKWVDFDLLIRTSTAINSLGSYQMNIETNLYLLRYAHVLLTYAEAKAHSGNLDQSAYDAVNMIRRRANNVDVNVPSKYDLQAGLTPEQFADSVVWERAWELCFEPDGRWFDIIRLNLKEELENHLYPNDAADVVDESLLNEDWYFFLIPQEDRWVNPNY